MKNNWGFDKLRLLMTFNGTRSLGICECFPIRTGCGLGSEAVLWSRQEVRETVMFQSTWRHCGQLVRIPDFCSGVTASGPGPMGNEIVAEILGLLSPTSPLQTVSSRPLVLW